MIIPEYINLLFHDEDVHFLILFHLPRHWVLRSGDFCLYAEDWGTSQEEIKKKRVSSSRSQNDYSSVCYVLAEMHVWFPGEGASTCHGSLTVSHTHGMSALAPFPLPSSLFLHPVVCSTVEGLSKPVSQEAGNSCQLHFCVQREKGRKMLRW